MANEPPVDSQTSSPSTALAAIAALALVGVAVAGSRRGVTGRRAPVAAEQRRAALAAYLRDHLTGADAAIQVMDSLADSGSARQQLLFAGLAGELREDREVVRALLGTLGGSAVSIKRLAGKAGGTILGTATGTRGELALFRTLEALSIGVQGKRCLWRAAQTLEPGLRAPGRRSFADLEGRAIRQWDAIEEYRRSLAPATFGP